MKIKHLTSGKEIEVNPNHVIDVYPNYKPKKDKIPMLLDMDLLRYGVYPIIKQTSYPYNIPVKPNKKLVSSADRLYEVALLKNSFLNQQPHCA